MDNASTERRQKICKKNKGSLLTIDGNQHCALRFLKCRKSRSKRDFHEIKREQHMSGCVTFSWWRSTRKGTSEQVPGWSETGNTTESCCAAYQHNLMRLYQGPACNFSLQIQLESPILTVCLHHDLKNTTIQSSLKSSSCLESTKPIWQLVRTSSVKLKAMAFRYWFV